MAINCGSQVGICEVPVRFDTYTGCSHACKYCFVKRKSDISKIEAQSSISGLIKFIEGKRTSTTNWCDWKIPLHWGGVSDPFQKLERVKRVSFEALKIFAATKYPFIVSTKGNVICDDDYLALLRQCRAVVQISMVCQKYDRLEPGAPKYEDRIEMLRKLAPNCLRLIVRIQPYLPEVFSDVIANLPRLKECGVYGVVVEGMKFTQKAPGTERFLGDNVYALEVLKRDFLAIKAKCRDVGLKFYCGENRLRFMGDASCCCGIEGLEGFTGNSFNALNLMHGDSVKPTNEMLRSGNTQCFKALYQDKLSTRRLKVSTFGDEMLLLTQKYLKVFPIKEIRGNFR